MLGISVSEKDYMNNAIRTEFNVDWLAPSEKTRPSNQVSSKMRDARKKNVKGELRVHAILADSTMFRRTA